MKIVVISDSHGNKLGINKLVRDIQFDYLFFLGDGLGDIGELRCMDNVIVVSGNCDFFSDEPNERFFELEGKRIFITHGNRYGVKIGLGSLLKRAKELDAQFVFYGHTHNRVIQQIDGINFINPGKFSKNSDGSSLGLEIYIEGDKVKSEVLKII